MLSLNKDLTEWTRDGKYGYYFMRLRPYYTGKSTDNEYAISERKTKSLQPLGRSRK